MHQNEGIQVEILNEQKEDLVKPCPKSLGEFMFKHTSNSDEVNLKTGEEVFIKYSKILTSSYKKL